MIPLLGRETELKKPGPLMRVLYLLIAGGVPIGLVSIAPALLDAPVRKYFEQKGEGAPSGADFADAALVVLLAFSGVVALLGAMIRAVVHDLSDPAHRGKAWDSAGKHLAILATSIATAAALVRFGIGIGAEVPVWIIAGAVVVGGGCTWAFYSLARWVQRLEGKLLKE